MPNTKADTTPVNCERAKILIAALVAAIDILILLIYSNQPVALRAVLFIGGFCISTAIIFTGQAGRKVLDFFCKSLDEVKRVSWPTKKETTQTTLIVFALVTIIGLFMHIFDKSIEWLLYSLFWG